MKHEIVERIRRTMNEQKVRKKYPEDFPALPTIPSARYFDPAFAQAEMQHMWKKTWLLAGLESDLPGAGSYILFEQLGLSIIISRGKDGVIRAFHNTCRHRSSSLLAEPKGKVSRFTCPYHAWSYSLDGSLTTVPMAYDFACLDKSERGLLPVRCETWRRLIFINLDPEATSLANFMQPLEAHTEGFPLENLVIKDHYFAEMDCNWKLAYHNFLEIYHVSLVHPKSLAPHLDSDSFVFSLAENGHGRIAVQKRQGSSIYKSDAIVPDDVDDGFKRAAITIQMFPNVSCSLDPGGFTIQSFWPAGEDRSIMELRLVGWPTEADNTADSHYWAEMRKAVDVLLIEDLRLFPSIQRGVKAGFVTDVTMGYQERGPYWFEEELDRTIGAEHIPENMHVKQVLEECVDR